MSVELAAGEWTATFVPELGMLGVSLTHRGDELLHLHGGPPSWQVGGRFGLPLLAPWANRLSQWSYRIDGVEVDLRGLTVVRAEGHGLPIHGTMVAQPGWEVARREPARMTARFAYDRPDLLAAFPFPHELELDVALDEGLRVESAVVARDRPVPIAFGWHPYFRADRGSTRLALPERRVIVLDGRGIPTGREEERPPVVEPLVENVYDDHYALVGEPLFRLDELEIRFDEGYPYAQVFAPQGGDFVAIEPMTARVNALVDGSAPRVEPGARFAARFTVALAAE